MTDRRRLALNALDIFPFCSDAWSQLGHCYRDAKDFDLALKTYQTGALAGQKVDPTLLQKNKIEWGFMDNRPYLRCLWGEMIVHRDMNKMASAIEFGKHLLSLNSSAESSCAMAIHCWTVRRCRKNTLAISEVRVGFVQQCARHESDSFPREISSRLVTQW